MERLALTRARARPAPYRCIDGAGWSPVAQTSQSAVSRISNPQALGSSGACRLEVGDTAGWKPALLPVCEMRIRCRARPAASLSQLLGPTVRASIKLSRRLEAEELARHGRVNRYHKLYEPVKVGGVGANARP